jgi:hypothetical protein
LTKDEYRLLGYGILTAALVAAALVPIFAFNLKVPKIVTEAIVAAIAVAVFSFSKRERTDKDSD